VAGGTIDASEAERVLVEAGLAIGKGLAEVQRTVRDGLSKGGLQPRVPAPRPVQGTAPAPNGGVYRPTDAGNAQRLADRYSMDVRWSSGVQGDGWLVWDGMRWAPDTMQEVDRFALAVADEVVRHAEAVEVQLRQAQASASDPPQPAEARRINDLRQEHRTWAIWARQSEMQGHLRACQVVARQRLAVDQERLDADDWIINTPSGKSAREDEVKIRSTASSARIPIMTTLRAAAASLEGIRAIREHGLSVKTLQEFHGI
jgi:hypothetical protein